MLNQFSITDRPLSFPECATNYGEGSIVDSMLCAGEAGIDSCQVGRKETFADIRKFLIDEKP